jgi:hypothetical protein
VEGGLAGRLGTDDYGARIERVQVGIRCENELFAVFSRRPPDSSDTIVANTDTYAAKVWALSIVQEPFSVALCGLIDRFATNKWGVV